VGNKTNELQKKTLQTLEDAGVLSLSALKKYVHGNHWKACSVGDFIKQEIETALRPYDEKPEGNVLFLPI
jgi:hypothetical protein